MSNSLMNTGISGLNAAQNMLNVISNNISNAHTAGYNRQQQVLTQANGTHHNFGFVGNGVSVSAVNRAFNQFVVGQLRQSESQSGSIKAYYNELSKVDNLLAENETSLSSQMNNLFTSLKKLTSNAGDASTKQSVISDLTSLVAQFNKTENSLKNQIANINTELTNNVDQINTYLEQIAELNQKISKLQAVSGGNEPNALLDQRDQLVNQLSEIIGITVTEQNGQYNLSLSNGLSLVQGSSVNLLSVQPSQEDPSLNTIIYTHNSGATQELTSQNIASGRLNGILTFRDGPLSQTRNQLGLIALNLAERFNEVHMSGVDINGNAGEKLFDYRQPSSITNSKNQGNAVAKIHFDSVNNVKASDYRIEFNGSDWVVTRLSDNQTITPQIENGKLVFDGLSIEITGNPVKGDSFLIKPVADIASSLELLVKDVDKLATGIDDEENGAGDNRNVTKLLDIQNEKLINGTATLSSAYNKLVNYIGSETQTSKVSAQSSHNITQQIYEQNQSISGVNLEEEYISMQVYMQYYQANAKVIDAATTLFDTILSLAK
ncbi:flagellar hook-associated protein FlgK [Gilliamella sp. Choc4-2]|jgi:flagellar hook-associated protein 1|uniref:flagellar hook-associated protein FlgK n=1 Tax=unclassified Gilliamella TaxID=2685620 RepID=UPI00080D9EEC|nr:flagellar hook-associated protein FlgK [Gilliamella apicola]OCG31042.1 flagellar hook-associated protein FlgK [Gilliamella apicola]OCG46610.1 flagellar hook-associated protein FlgK [Gilliamella apicola]